MFQKTLAVSDYYFGSDDWEYPLGLIQMCATSHGAQIRGEALPGWLEWVPKMPFEEMARHSMDFWLSSEDLPRPENRIFYDGDRVCLDVTEGNMEAHHRLKKKLEQMLSRAGAHPVLLERSLYLGKNIPIGGTAHQAGHRAISARIRQPRCSISTARRTSSTISISPMPVSFRRSAR